MTESTAEQYKNYWCGLEEVREKSAYYKRLYEKVYPKIKIENNGHILDVAGGNGQFMRYLGIERADILDISESGLEIARKAGFNTIYGNIEKRFPLQEESYDVAFCFEVLEHLHHPNKTLAEINNILKKNGVLYLGQPNMRADGVHHVRRYYLQDLLDDLDKSGFQVEWVDFVPGYSMRDAILSDIRKNPSWVRKIIQCVNLTLSFLPWWVRYQMAKLIPNRFALIFIVKASNASYVLASFSAVSRSSFESISVHAKPFTDS